MKIAIEAQRIFRPNKHGMDFVALETIRCLQRLDTKNEYFIFTGEGEDRCLEESPNMHITTLRCPSYPLWEQWALPRAVARVKPDLLHCTSNTAPVWGNAPLILTLHDIIFLEQQAARNKSLYQSLGRVYRRLVVPRILPRCRMVITVSQFECDRIRTALNFDPGRIMAIHNGYNDRFRPMEGTAETVRKYLRDPEYLFFLGNTDPKKNTPGTLKAYAEYVRRSENPLPLLVADHYVSRTVIDDRIILDQGVASHFEAPPGKNVEPRMAADKRPAAFFVNKRVHEPAHPKTGPGVPVRRNQPDDELFEPGVISDLFNHKSITVLYNELLQCGCPGF